MEMFCETSLPRGVVARLVRSACEKPLQNGPCSASVIRMCVCASVHLCVWVHAHGCVCACVCTHACACICVKQSIPHQLPPSWLSPSRESSPLASSSWTFAVSRCLTPPTCSCTVVPFYLWFRFLWFQLPMANHGQKILSGKLEKWTICVLNWMLLWVVWRNVVPTHPWQESSSVYAV